MFGLTSIGPNTRRRRIRQIALWLATALVTLTFLAIVDGRATSWGVPAGLQQVGMVLTAMAVLVLFGVQWAEFDEVERQRHTTAFTWAGAISWSAVLLVIGVSEAGGGTPSMPVFAAALSVIGLHAMLYLAIAAILWLRQLR
jgi:hypothetical protein